MPASPTPVLAKGSGASSDQLSESEPANLSAPQFPGVSTRNHNASFRLLGFVSRSKRDKAPKPETRVRVCHSRRYFAVIVVRPQGAEGRASHDGCSAAPGA